MAIILRTDLGMAGVDPADTGAASVLVDTTHTLASGPKELTERRLVRRGTTPGSLMLHGRSDRSGRRTRLTSERPAEVIT